MKKSYIAIIIILALTLVLGFFLLRDNTEGIEVKVPEIEVIINEDLLKNKTLKYPLITYKQVSYVPMNQNFMSKLGLNVEENAEEGMLITTTKSDDKSELEKSKQEEIIEIIANLYDGKITFNEVLIKKEVKDRPVLIFKEVIYIPLTWKYATNLFEWDYYWTNVGQLNINSKNTEKTNKITLSEKEEPTNLIEEKDEKEDLKGIEQTILEQVVIKGQVQTFKQDSLTIIKEVVERENSVEKIEEEVNMAIEVNEDIEITKEIKVTKEIEIIEETKELPKQKGKNIKFKVIYNFDVPGKTEQITFTCTLPKNYERRQTVNDIDFSIKPKKVFESNGINYATFVINNPDKKVVLEIINDLTLYEYDYEMAKKFGKSIFNDKNLFLKSELNIESDNSTIINALKIDNLKEEEKLKTIYEFVIDRLSYKDIDYDEGAIFAYNNREGDCQEYADLFIGLCRAEGIPARIAEGFATNGTANGHEWVEAYINGLGWVPFDLTYADSEYAEDDYTFTNLNNVYIYYSHLRNDPEFSYTRDNKKNYGHYWNCSFKGDRISVNREIEVK